MTSILEAPSGGPWLEVLLAVHEVLNLPDVVFTDEHAQLCDDILAARAVQVVGFIEDVIADRTQRPADIHAAAKRFALKTSKDYPADGFEPSVPQNGATA